MFKGRSIVLVLGILFAFSCAREAKKEVQNEQVIVQWARDHLPQSGVLKQNERGYVYLKVDDGYINQLFPLLQDSGYMKPEYFRHPNSPGAHISVIYREERKKKGKIREIGQRFKFKVSNLAVVPWRSRTYIVLQVNSPELEQLRMKYGLSPLLRRHHFHITIAWKKHRHFPFRMRRLMPILTETKVD